MKIKVPEQLKSKDLKAFQELYFKKYKVWLNSNDAQVEAKRFLNFLAVMLENSPYQKDDL